MFLNEIFTEDINPDILHPEFRHRQAIGDFVYTAESKKYFNTDTLKIWCFDGRKEVASVLFEVKQKNKSQWLESVQVWVDDDYRGLGLASGMYAYARSLGNTIKPSKTQTPQGQAMWAGWERTGQAQHLIKESLSRVAYHYTGTMAALKILRSGNFELSSALGSVEQQYMPKGKPYFMSATRTRRGGYHSGSTRRGVLFVLDGNWFNQRYKSGPLDYWGNRGTGYRASEAEDRIYSPEPTIPIDGVIAIHVFLDVFGEDEKQVNHDQSIVRELLIAAKTRGIATYFYNDKDAWLSMDTRRLADVGQLTGSRQPSWYRPMRRRSYMQSWIELMNAKTLGQLSKDADKIRYNLNYTYDQQAAAEALNNDMSNARKPDSGQEREDAVKIIAYMRQNRLNTIADFVAHIAAKWKNITKVNEATLPKNEWQLVVSNADKLELGDELVNLVRTAYSSTNLGSMVNSLREVIPSDWNVIDWDDEPDVDATVFYRYARPKDNWVGVKIQGLGHDGSRTSKDKAIAKIQELLSQPGYWIESSDAMRRVWMKLNLPAVTDEKFLQQLFNDPDLKMIDDNTYVRTLANGQQITETVFGHPALSR